MPFSKTNYSPEIEIVATHRWYPGDKFVFTLPKVLPESALDAEAGFLGLNGTERDDQARRALISVVAQMVTKEPEGFEDFPQDARPLAERFVEYFDDPSKPELENILVGVWREYRGGAVSSTYLKSREDSRAAVGQPSAVPSTP
jgi:hypothetical protein